MQRRDAFPAEAGEEGDAVIFLVLRKGLEVSHDEIGKSEERQGNGEREEAMRFVRLKRECDGRDDIREMNSEEKFSRAAIDEAKWWDGICEDNGKGEEKKEERGKREGFVCKENVCG